MELSIFDIPLLKDLVIQDLSLHDITQCAQVSKQWNAWFTPTIWNTVNLDALLRITPIAGMTALERNHYNVRSITAFVNFFDHLHNQKINYSAQLKRLLRFLETCSRLHTLRIDYFRGDNILQTKLVSTLNSLVLLKKLDLIFYRWVHSLTVLGIILASSREVEHLQLDIESTTVGNFDPEENLEPERSLIAKSAIEQMNDTQFKALSIALSNTFQDHDILIALLNRCPLLESLNLKYLHDPATTLPMISMIIWQRRRLPLLKHLYLGAFTKADFCNDAVLDMLSAVGSIRGSGDGLETIEIHTDSFMGRMRAAAIIQGHHNSLTSLRLLGCSLEFRNFVQILSGLPKLRQLDIGVKIKERGHDEENLLELFQVRWACTNLSKLKLNLEMGQGIQDIGGAAWQSSLQCQRTSYIIFQLAGLKELEDLNLISKFDLLNLKNGGYLDRLNGLKKLKRLTLRRDSMFSESYHMGASEGQWIVENWPSLTTIDLPERLNIPSRKWDDIFEMKKILQDNIPSIQFKNNALD
ncbi:hypothetical protein BGZ76_004450 [Entomortierella beljakovae]|nr:hypothetical protein BGZ76_004450 [Entomortierella beljakovae]